MEAKPENSTAIELPITGYLCGLRAVRLSGKLYFCQPSGESRAADAWFQCGIWFTQLKNMQLKSSWVWKHWYSGKWTWCHGADDDMHSIEMWLGISPLVSHIQIIEINNGYSTCHRMCAAIAYKSIRSGGWFNIKMASYQYKNPIVEIRRS